MKFYSKKSGFTLVELLVVISIVALLSSVVFTSLANARSKARHAVRQSDLRQLYTALMLYYEINGSYPSTGSTWYGRSGVTTTACTGWYTATDTWIPGLVSGGFISKLPTDPSNSGSCYQQYLYISNGTDFKLISHDIGYDGGNAQYANSPLRDPNRDGGSVANVIDGNNPRAIGYYSTNGASW